MNSCVHLFPAVEFVLLPLVLIVNTELQYLGGEFVRENGAGVALFKFKS